MYRTVNNAANLLIAKDINRAIAAGTKVEASTLADGEVVLTDKYGREIEAGALLGATEFFVVQGQGASKPLIKSDLISVSTVKSVKKQSYVAPVEQVDVITGIAGTAAGLYEIRVLEQGITTVFGNHLNEMIVGYTAKASDTAVDIAARLAKDLSKEVSKRANPNFIVERIADSGATFTALTNNATVTNKSELVTSTAHALVANDSVTIAGVLYRVASVLTANTFLLDQPYQGASGTVLAANITKTTSITTVDIKLTGLAKKFAVGKFRYEKNRWATTVQGEGMANDAVTIVNSALAKEGSGTYEQVAEFEWFAQGFEGVLERIQIPPVTFRANVEAGATYDIYTIEFTDALSSTSITGAIPVSHKQLYIATKVGAGTQDAEIQADLEDILNVTL